MPQHVRHKESTILPQGSNSEKPEHYCMGIQCAWSPLSSGVRLIIVLLLVLWYIGSRKRLCQALWDHQHVVATYSQCINTSLPSSKAHLNLQQFALILHWQGRKSCVQIHLWYFDCPNCDLISSLRSSGSWCLPSVFQGLCKVLLC